MGGLFPSPGASCVEGGLHRALFTTRRTHTKTGLSSTGVGHQREGRGGWARKEGRKAERKEERRCVRGGEGPQALAHMPAPLSRDC